jgi:CDP-glucose 4,6-dehydratase
VGQRRAALGDMGIDPAFWKGRRVLLTGNTGFKGSWLSLWLLEMGSEVHGLAPGPPTDPSLYELAGLGEHISQFAIDIRDIDGVTDAVRRSGADVVIHMAAQPFVRRSFREPRDTYEINVMGTINLFEAVRAAGDQVRVVLNVTSDKCYENREWEWGYRESEAMGGYDPYSNSKGCSELVTQAYRSSFFNDPDGPRLASGRAGNVIGGGDWGEDRLIPDIMSGAVANTPVHIRRPDAIRPWQHVLNPLSGYLVLVQALWDDHSFATGFNFGPADDDVQPVAHVVERLTAAWPDKIDWRIDPGPHPHEATWLKLDSSRARARLGWQPLWNLDQALASIGQWYVALQDGRDMREITRAQIAEFATGPR